VSVAAVLDAERIKLSTTRAPFWSAVCVAVISLAYAGLQSETAKADHPPITPEWAALGVAMLGVPVLMIVAATTVTNEYRTGLIRTTLLATPNRTLVLSAKAAITATFTAAFTAVLTAASILIAKELAKPPVAVKLSLDVAATWRPVGALALYAGLCAILAVGLGALIRYSAGIVTVLLLVPFVIEPLVGSLPRLGPKIGPFMPFDNAFVFTKTPWLIPSKMHWGPSGALAYFAGVVVVVFIAGIAAINRRDA
jgi:ABC-2 type transport system permease protein